MIYVGTIVLTIIVIGGIVVIVVCVKYKRNQTKKSEEYVTNNPMYGMDYDDYYAETNLEETNPHYDAYYKDDYYTTNC